jgi:hypothetical protein
MTTHIIDSTGRRGIITEHRNGGVFARPADMPASLGFGGNAKLTTATFWSIMPDGSLRGLWVDSAHNGFANAKFACALEPL